MPGQWLRPVVNICARKHTQTSHAALLHVDTFVYQ